VTVATPEAPVSGRLGGAAAAQVWDAYCDSLKIAGQQLLRNDFPIDQLDLAEGLRYLVRLVFTSIDRTVEGADPSHPLLYPLCNERIKVGGDNPDNRYYAAAISDGYEYVLRGDFRGCSYFSVVSTGKVDGSESVISGSLRGDDLETLPDGYTEIHISARTTGRNVLPTDARTSLLIVRCTIEGSLEGHVAPTLQRIDKPGPPPTLSLDEIAGRLNASAQFVRNASAFFGDFTAKFQAHVNTLPLFPDQRYLVSIGGDPNILYYLSAWALKEDEVLCLSMPRIPHCSTWNLQLCNVWFESLDYTASQIHINSNNAVYEANGGVTICIAQRDPRAANWLRTLGHTSGLLCMRLVGAEEAAVVNASVHSVSQAPAAI
jgi:Protein of unknown function (DUF1214)